MVMKNINLDDIIKNAFGKNKRFKNIPTDFNCAFKSNGTNVVEILVDAPLDFVITLVKNPVDDFDAADILEKWLNNNVEFYQITYDGDDKNIKDVVENLLIKASIAKSLSSWLDGILVNGLKDLKPEFKDLLNFPMQCIYSFIKDEHTDVKMLIQLDELTEGNGDFDNFWENYKNSFARLS